MDIDLDRLAELMRLMEENDLAELEVESGDFKVRLKKRPTPGAPELVAMPLVPPVTVPPGGHGASGAASAASSVQPAAETAEDLIEITSPMVGTFYRTPAPDAEPYVRVGDAVHEDTVVCIIEAMKVMNEIKAETEGEIVEVKAGNGEAVEFGQVLFIVRPGR